MQLDIVRACPASVHKGTLWGVHRFEFDHLLVR
jgi:hypothetical protein